jgi:hypothetical protein
MLKDKKVLILIGVMIAFIIGAYFVGYFTDRRVPPEPSPISDNNGTSRYVITKESAVMFVQDFFIEVNRDPRNRTLWERFELLETTSPNELLTPESIRMMHLSDYFSTDNRALSVIAQSLFSLLGVITNHSESIQVQIWDFDDIVFLDEELGIAFVPMDVFTGGVTGYSVNLIYLDGEWKFMPFSLLDSVRLSLILDYTYN